MSLKCQMNEWQINVCISNIISMINGMKWNIPLIYHMT